MRMEMRSSQVIRMPARLPAMRRNSTNSPECHIVYHTMPALDTPCALSQSIIRNASACTLPHDTLKHGSLLT